MCSREQFEAWPNEIQDAVLQATRDATALQRQLAIAEDTEVLARLDPEVNEEIELRDSERQLFMSAVQPVLERHGHDIVAATVAALNA